jgi:hypothetical protein
MQPNEIFLRAVRRLAVGGLLLVGLWVVKTIWW